jgi:outer membrane protein assembly factor BamD
MRKIIAIISILTLISACGTHKEIASKRHHRRHKDSIRWTYNRVLKSDNYDLKYKWATKYYNKGKYSKAMDLYQQLVPYEKGLAKGEDVEYKFAACNYKIGEDLYAAYLFKKFYNDYPNSKFAESALFMSAYCNYLASPRWSLDQKETHQAIDQFQLFLNKYPKSPLVDSTNTLVDTLNYKLEKKSYRGAKLYYDIEYYMPATIALNNSITDNPGSPFNEYAEYYIVKAAYKYAQNSIETKQKERYNKVISDILRYKSDYPNGKHIKDINNILKNTQKKLKQISK